MYTNKAIIKNGKIVNAWTIENGAFHWLTVEETERRKKTNPRGCHDGVTHGERG